MVLFDVGMCNTTVIWSLYCDRLVKVLKGCKPKTFISYNSLHFKTPSFFPLQSQMISVHIKKKVTKISVTQVL